jgi:DNA-binding transcriptional ArsR family regulator
MDPAEVLFSRTQRRLLAALFGGPRPRHLSYSELLRLSGGGAGAIHRELMQFLGAGLVVENRSGGRRVFASNPAHPAHRHLRALTDKLLGERRLDRRTARRLARKYVWWKAAGDAARDQERLVAQVMSIGTYDDIQLVAAKLGEDYLRGVLKHAEAGIFNERAWAYWHYRLGLARPGRVPPLPHRSLG